MNVNKKILFIARGPSPYRVDFFNELGKLCDLTVLFEMRPSDINDRNSSWFKEEYQFFEAIYLKSINFNIGCHKFCPSILKYLKLYKKYDHIIVGMYSTPTQLMSIMYMKIKGIKYALNSDGGFIKKESYFKRTIKKFFIKGAEFYLSSSKTTNKYLEHYGADSDIYIYPFTTYRNKDLNKDIINEKEKLHLRKKLNMQEDIIVISVGQFIYRKGFDILIKSCKNLNNNIGVYIIGDNVTPEYLELKERLSIDNVKFIGFKNKDELANYYQAADIFVLPTREDIWGLVINEAMVYGLPVITTNKCLAGLELIKNEKNGYIINTNDVKELSSKINKLANDDDIRRDMGVNNREKIKLYSIENMAIQHYHIFENLNCAETS